MLPCQLKHGRHEEELTCDMQGKKVLYDHGTTLSIARIAYSASGIVLDEVYASQARMIITL